MKDADPGFPERARRVPVPDLFFARFLPRLADPIEIKVFLHIVWKVHRRPRTRPPALRVMDLAADPTLARSLAVLSKATRAGPVYSFAAVADFGNPAAAGAPEASGPAEVSGSREAHLAAITSAVDRLVHGGLLVDARMGEGVERQHWLWVNNPAGRRARDDALVAGMPQDEPLPVARDSGPEGPSIFTLYEENIGPLTPLLAEELAEAEATYSQRRIEAAFRAAVVENVRKWSYVRAILERMTRERGDGADRQGGEGARARYREGPYSDYIEG